MKPSFTTFLSRVAMVLLLALLTSVQGAWAKNYISEVKLIGGTKSEVNQLKTYYQNKGWKIIDYDLNKGCGSSSDYIYLMYKTSSSLDDDFYITDFYIREGKNPPSDLYHNGRLYELTPYDGGEHFEHVYGDLNSNAEGQYIYLYYTKDWFPDLRAVTSITFNSTQSGAVGLIGDDLGYDLNTGCGSGTDYIYMHFTTERMNELFLDYSTTDLMLYDGDVLYDEGGSKTHLTIAPGATVTLCDVVIKDLSSSPEDVNIWPAVTCLGDATIIFDKDSKCILRGGYGNPAIFIPEGHTLTLRGDGKLYATGGDNAAAIGGSYNAPCGDIVIEGGDMTVVGGHSSAGIGSGNKGSCGKIVIKGGSIASAGGNYGAGIGGGGDSSIGDIIIKGGSITAASSKDGAGIGCGNNGSCNNIVIEGGSIFAEGVGNGAGIGGSYMNTCGNISLKGGDITATGGTQCPAIGSGCQNSCGSINIEDGISRVSATKGYFAWTAIGAGNRGSCGTITISESLADVTFVENRILYHRHPVALSNNKFYKLATQRGEMVMNADGTGLASGQERTDAPEEDKRFAIITYDGKHYLYCPKAKMYLKYDCTLVPRLGSPFVIDADAFPSDNEYKYIFFTNNDDGATLTLNNVGPSISIFGTYDASDANRWRIEEAGEFNPQEALDIAATIQLYDDNNNTAVIDAHEGDVANVRLGGHTLYTDGSWNTLCLPFDVDNLEGQPLEGFTVMELDTENAYDGHTTGFALSDFAYHLNFKPATSIKAGRPYIVRNNVDKVICSASDWNNFAASVANGSTYEGKVVHLAADITVSTMVGTSNYRFKGTFDGNGHLLTLTNLPATGQYCAPFRHVDGATIRNLHTTGTLTASEKYRSGLIGECYGKVTIDNCWSSVAINSSVNGDGTHGGFIGEVKSSGNVVIDNCLFDGSFTGASTSCWGGFVGWSQGTTTIKNSAFLPEGIYSLDNSNSNTFGRNRVTTVNCYYSSPLGDAQGTAVGSMGSSQLASALGNGWMVEGDKVMPVMGTSVITDPVFNHVAVKKDAPTTVTSADGAVLFTGSYNPVSLGGNDYPQLFLGGANTLHHPNGNMTIGSFQAIFQQTISSLGDVNSDGDVNVTDVTNLVNLILSNTAGYSSLADVNRDGQVSITDVTSLVDIILSKGGVIINNIVTNVDLIYGETGNNN
ncbi:MAG: dockerin type I repeat-containing protein [Prevotella sp.]|nr:dockerin type I repeat-containing protein [Prevotella sp.]